MVRIVVVHDRISQDSCSVLDSEVFAVDKCSTEKTRAAKLHAAVDFWLVSSRAAPRLARQLCDQQGANCGVTACQHITSASYSAMRI